MKTTIFLSIVLFLFPAIDSRAQEIKTLPKRIAFYNATDFEDADRGITRLVQAISVTYTCVFGPMNEKQKAAYEESNKKRFKIVVEPVQNEISAVIKQTGAEQNLVILNLSEIDNNGQLLFSNDKLGITQKLISYLNEYFKTKTKPEISFDLPAPKLGRIDTDAFFDETTGLKRFSSLLAPARDSLRKETGREPAFDEIQARFFKDNPRSGLFSEVGVMIQNYAIEEGFDLVLDSSKKTLPELESFQIQDVTKDFISYYNQKNR